MGTSSAFTDKHVLVALIVAPILAIFAWFGVGQLAAEKPRPAQAGESYPLVEQSNCRYASGVCDLENQDFKLSVQLGADLFLVVQSAHVLEGVMLAVGDPGRERSPVAMQALDREGLSWRYQLSELPRPGDRIHLVAATHLHAYFADAATAFIQRDITAGAAR